MPQPENRPFQAIYTTIALLVQDLTELGGGGESSDISPPNPEGQGGNFGCFPPYRGGNFVIPPPEAENFEDLGSCFKQKTRSKCTLERVFPVETPPTSPKNFPPAAGQERVFPVKIPRHPRKNSPAAGHTPINVNLL
mgnify:CR=1 FL=1